MRLKFHVCGFLIAGLAVAGVAHAAPILVNGSLTGPIANGGVPAGWTALAGSPDTMDEGNNVGVGGLLGFVTAPAGPSPDGGTWVGFAHDGAFVETFGQTIAGFTVGTEYTLTWYLGNFGFDGVAPPYGSPNGVEVLLDGASVGSSPIVASGSDWTEQSFSFIALAVIQEISFRPVSTDRSYISIDGIRLEDATPAPIPEPASLLLLGTGGLGVLTALRRRKRTQS